jgi:hypothetical protein
MLQTTRTFAMSLAVLFLTGAVAPSPADAWSLSTVLHLHPHSSQQRDPRIVVDVYNKNNTFQEIVVAGHVYTVMPHYGLTVKAPAGTGVFANTTNIHHRKGDLLFSVTPDRNNTTVPIS